jgi:hypothetical protein
MRNMGAWDRTCSLRTHQIGGLLHSKEAFLIYWFNTFDVLLHLRRNKTKGNPYTGDVRRLVLPHQVSSSIHFRADSLPRAGPAPSRCTKPGSYRRIRGTASPGAIVPEFGLGRPRCSRIP